MHFILGGGVHSGTCVGFTDVFLSTMERKFTLYLYCSKRPVFARAELKWLFMAEQTVPMIKVEMTDPVYIQVILNGTWQCRGSKALAGMSLHIIK